MRWLALFLLAPAAGSAGEEGVEVASAEVRFTAPANLGLFDVEGRGEVVRGSARLQREPDALVLEDLRVAVPVASLATGIGTRDRHMREQIFRSGEGELPDATFRADRVRCPRRDGAARCQVAGFLSLGGVERELEVDLELEPEAEGLRARARGVIPLSRWGIAPPARLGIRIQDEITFLVEGVGRVRAR